MNKNGLYAILVPCGEEDLGSIPCNYVGEDYIRLTKKSLVAAFSGALKIDLKVNWAKLYGSYQSDVNGFVLDFSPTSVRTFNKRRTKKATGPSGVASD